MDRHKEACWEEAQTTELHNTVKILTPQGHHHRRSSLNAAGTISSFPQQPWLQASCSQSPHWEHVHADGRQGCLYTCSHIPYSLSHTKSHHSYSCVNTLTLTCMYNEEVCPVVKVQLLFSWCVSARSPFPSIFLTQACVEYKVEKTQVFRESAQLKTLTEYWYMCVYLYISSIILRYLSGQMEAVMAVLFLFLYSNDKWRTRIRLRWQKAPIDSRWISVAFYWHLHSAHEPVLQTLFWLSFATYALERSYCILLCSVRWHSLFIFYHFRCSRLLQWHFWMKSHAVLV